MSFYLDKYGTHGIASVQAAYVLEAKVYWN